MFELSNKVDFDYAHLDEAFPACDPGVQPFGSRVLVQIRTPKRKTKGGIILTSETRETDAWNTQIAKVIAVGALAFKNRTTMAPWPEGGWCAVGDFVRVPKYGGDRWTVKTTDGEDEALLVIFNDLDLVGKVTGDPLAIKAFI
jgi:co-chaperonin GroES (HSP10)